MLSNVKIWIQSGVIYKIVYIFVILRDVKKLVSIWVLLRSYYNPTLSKIPSVALAILPSVLVKHNAKW